MSTEKTASEQLNESLSAFVDGEASALEVRRLLKSDDPALRGRWQRYQLISASMRAEVSVPEMTDLSTAIAEAVAREPSYVNPAPGASPVDAPSASPRRLWGTFGRFGIAASVAGALVLGVQFAAVDAPVNVAHYDLQASSSAPTTLATKALAPVPGVPVGVDTSARHVSQFDQSAGDTKQPILLNRATKEQLEQIEGEVERLMLEHAQNAAQNTQSGLLPYVRVPDAEQE